ncbi:MAG TPA: hypothetical protein VMV79_01705 [Alphaproteobacteria bacterium]|nr:hypothetical protein [Alphaproteobacteria bacterium]
MLNFHDLETKFGAAAAYQYLTEIEKAAAIPSWQMAEIDPETRLANALAAQDVTPCAAAA